MSPARVRTAALGAVLVLALAGCAEIPTAGDVLVGPTHNTANQDVVLVPYAPVAGASPTDIVQGFVTAATGQQGDYEVARKFLAPALAKRWRPGARVLIHSEPWVVNATSDTSITLSVPVSAQVNADGVYTSFTTPRNRAVPFRLAKVNGQWRITSTPDGIVLGDNYFSSLFTARPVDFFDPGYSRTVADLRWFPARNISPAAVVRALLAGPSAPIDTPVTATAFPPGTTVTSVTPTSGVATVDLAIASGAPGSTALRRMKLQLTQSLQNLSGIQRVQLAVNGRPVPAPDLTLPPVVVSPQPLVLRNGVVGTLSGTAFTPETTLGRSIAAARPLAGTVSVSQGVAAVRNAAGVVVVTRAGQRLVDTRPNLVDPTLDDQNWTYSVPRTQPGSWRAFDARGHESAFDVAMPGVDEVTAIEASRDGTRMLVLAQSAAGPLAFVAGIVRDDSGAPIALTTARYSVPMPQGTATALDATWADADGSSVAVLTQDTTGEGVTVQQLGGVPSTVGRLSMARTLVGATNLKELRALLQNGSIAELGASVWQSSTPDPSVTVLFVQR